MTHIRKVHSENGGFEMLKNRQLTDRKQYGPTNLLSQLSILHVV